ncbi:MAG TPA: hypothetical protein VN969_15450 [Streptosporangiaceae bacterium]|nr:hypothetical protein [Streptosporangiaceae bacterium]
MGSRPTTSAWCTRAVRHRDVLRMRADLDWHDELDKLIAERPD